MNKHYWVAFSGGLDSHVLLHLIATQYPELSFTAVHVNHHLQKKSVQWQKHCEKVCKQLKIPLKIISIKIEKNPGESLEAKAREMRYAALSKLLKKGDILLTAHHLDDQAETMLLQLFRGAGLKGIASMPSVKPLAKGYLARPLLKFTRAQLHAYANAHSLQWIEDDSNQDSRFDRNFLRHEIMPLIKQHWPQVAHTLVRFAKHAAEQEQLIQELLQEESLSLKTSELKQMSSVKQQTVLRHWIKAHGFVVPSQKVLEQIQQTVLHAKQDAMPKVCWGDVVCRRYRDELFVFSESPRSTALTKSEKKWCARHVKAKNIMIKFREYGEKFKPQGSRYTKTLKKLFQEWGVPPWLRDKIPLVFHNDRLIAVVGYAVSDHVIPRSARSA